MIKCKVDGCPKNKKICCECCDEKCERICSLHSTECENIDFEESTSLDVFQSRSALVIKTIEDLCIRKKILENQEKEMREKLEKVMGECGIKFFENDLLKITYVEPGTRETFDTAKFKKQYPDIAKNFTKVSQVKSSIRITLKEGE